MSAFYIPLGLKMTCYHSCRAVSHFQFTAYQNLISVPLQSFYLFVFGFTLILKTASFLVLQLISVSPRSETWSWTWCWSRVICCIFLAGLFTRATASQTPTPCTSPSPRTRGTAGVICCWRYLLSRLSQKFIHSFIYFRTLVCKFLASPINPQVMPAALEMAMEEDVEFRKGLPLDYLTYMGVQNSDKVSCSFHSTFTRARTDFISCIWN